MNQKLLIKKLKTLKTLEVAGQPQESWVARNREIMMSQVKPVASSNTDKYLLGSNVYYFKYFNNLFRQAYRPISTFVVVLFVFLGYTAMSSVASASLPGDMLYPIKTTTERVKLTLTFDNEKKVEMQMDIVSRRSDELQKIAKNPDTDSKKEKITQTAKQITQNIKEVKENLNKVASAPSASSVQLAKQVDEKTLKVEADIVNANASLSDDLKKEVAKDIKEAINKTGEAGSDALTIMVKTVEEKGDKSGVSDKDIANRVNERIKNVEVTIASASLGLSKISSTSTEVTVKNSTTTTAGIADMQDKPKLAQDVIDEAKNLLEKNELNSAIEKLQESKDIINDLIDKTQVMENTIKAEGDASTTSTTGSVIKNVSSSSSTVGTSVKPILIK